MCWAPSIMRRCRPGRLRPITADIWLLWATATTFKIFSPPQDARMVKYYYLVNFVIGAYLMARFFHVIDMGKTGVIG